MTDMIFKTDGEEKFRIPSNKLEILDSGYLNGPGTVCPKTPLHIREMTEIEKTEGEIKVLQAKLELLKEMEKHKSPVEKAYKEWWGEYPSTEKSVSETEDMRWLGFQAGYETAKQDYKRVEEPKPVTLSETFYDAIQKSDRHMLVDDFCEVVEEWLPDELEYDGDDYQLGWNDALRKIKEKLR